MGCFLSVVIDIINVLRAVVKAEHHPPVGPDSYGPEAFHLASERMQPEPRHVHMGNGWGGVKRCQNIPQLTNMFRIYAARIVQFKKPFQTLVADCPYHPDTAMRHVAHVKNNVSRLDVFTLAAGKCEASAERVVHASPGPEATRTDRR